MTTFYPGPLFTNKIPLYRYRNPNYKPKALWRPSQVYNVNPNTNNIVSLENRGQGTAPMPGNYYL